METSSAELEDWIGPYDCIVPAHLDWCIAADGCNRQFRAQPGGRPKGTKKGADPRRCCTRTEWLAKYTMTRVDGRSVYHAADNTQ